MILLYLHNRELGLLYVVVRKKVCDGKRLMKLLHDVEYLLYRLGARPMDARRVSLGAADDVYSAEVYVLSLTSSGMVTHPLNRDTLLRPQDCSVYRQACPWLECRYALAYAKIHVMLYEHYGDMEGVEYAADVVHELLL